MTTIAELHIGDDPVAWRAIGLDVDAGHTAHVGHVRLHVHPDVPERGIFRWVLAGTPDEDVTEVDGLPTGHGEPPSLAGLAPSHLIGRQLDQLVRQPILWGSAKNKHHWASGRQMKTSNNQVQATADCALLFVLCQGPAPPDPERYANQ